ncbi:hypothetical protein [Sphingomonas sp. 1P08PE]
MDINEAATGSIGQGGRRIHHAGARTHAEPGQGRIDRRIEDARIRVYGQR